MENSIQLNNDRVFCYGEVLWDIFPYGARAGGAPFNVAYNLRRMGVNSRAISRIGNDDLGRQLHAKLTAWGFPQADLQIDQTQPTGTVRATFDEHGEAQYDIVEPVAWDFIENTPGLFNDVNNAAAFVFGSLIARSAASRNTLFELLEASNLKIFDVNLREPYCDFAVINQLLHKADIVKMNKAEMRRVLESMGTEYTTEHDAVRYIQDYFSVNEILISKGSKGALYYDGHQDYFAPAVPVTVKDTVGSGDSFLAGFISKRIQGASPEDIMLRATALGAFVTSQEGACPEYTLADFENFVSHKTTTSI